jgi:hypothetical protein
MSSVTVRDNKTNKTISTFDSGFCPRVGEKFTKYNVHYSVMSVDFEVTSYGGLKPIVYVEEVKQIKMMPTHNVEEKQLKRIAKVVKEAQHTLSCMVEDGVSDASYCKRLSQSLEKLTGADGALLGLVDGSY